MKHDLSECLPRGENLATGRDKEMQVSYKDGVGRVRLCVLMA